jgi:hypothetical protein
VSHGRGWRGRGQSLVELALVAPILILLAMSVWDGGSVLREQVVLQQAARAGARVAATGYGTSVASSVVGNAVLASAGDLPGLSSTPGYLTISYPDAQSVRVLVRYDHALITPVLRQMWGNGTGMVALQASATFYVPQMTPVPGTVVPSTATPTPTPTMTPTPVRPTATPVPPTATPVPPTATPTISRLCTPSPSSQLLPALPTGYGFWCTLTVTTSSYVMVQWDDQADPNNVIGVYSTSPDPFLGRGDPVQLAPPSNDLAFNFRATSNNANRLPGLPPSSNVLIALSNCLRAGTYQLYFYNAGTALPRTTSSAPTAAEALYTCSNNNNYNDNGGNYNDGFGRDN